MRFSVRSSVDLPQPEGPISAVTLRSANGIETPFSAMFLP